MAEDKKHMHALVRRAAAAGELTRPPACESCGKPGRTEGHHHDYSQLNVGWPCRACRAAEHRPPGALASTHLRALEIVRLEILKAYSLDVPTDAAAPDE